MIENEVTNESSRDLKNLLDMPQFVIERIIDNLKLLEDRMNFGLSCRTINDILNKHVSSWKNVWLDLAGVVNNSEKFCLSREYSNLKWRNIDETPKSLYLAEIIARLEPIKSLAESVKMLRLHYKEAQDLDREIQLITFCLMTFDKLQHLEIVVGDQGRWERKNLPEEGVQQRQASIKLRDLEYLKIPLRLLDFFIDNRIVEITSCNLKTFRSGGYENPEERSTSWKPAILDLIKKQERLEYFSIGGDYGFLYDEQLQLKSKLKHCLIDWFGSEYDDIEPPAKLSDTQQDNMVDFLTSQNELQRVYFEFDGDSTPKMQIYRIKSLQLPQQARKIIINVEPDYCIGTAAFNAVEFGMSPQLASTSVESLSILILEGLEDMHENNDDGEWISDFAALFPNLSQLHISGEPVNLQRLRELQNLKHLKISESYHLLSGVMNDVVLPQLEEFEYGDGCNSKLMTVDDFSELRLFLSHHMQLKTFKIFTNNKLQIDRLGNHSEVAVSEFQSLLTEMIRFVVENFEQLQSILVADHYHFNDMQMENIIIESWISTHTAPGSKFQLAVQNINMRREHWIEITRSGQIVRATNTIEIEQDDLKDDSFLSGQLK